MAIIDPAVEAYLPNGAVILGAVPWGSSGWTRTTKITVCLPDDTEKDFFMKDCDAEVSHDMFRGEFHALSTMHQWLPEASPKPLGWGQYEDSPGTYFLVMEFLHLVPEMPSPSRITDLIVKFHKATMGTSPEGKFGFVVPTCHGKISQPNDWDDNWARFYEKLLQTFWDADIATNGPEEDYEDAFETIKHVVIPRLLEPLQANGRTITPCLVHGDLWEGNMGLNEETDDWMLFDPALFYGHHEFELGMWRTMLNPFDETYREQYCDRHPVSEPVEEAEDRIRLYSLLYHLSHSAHWPDAKESVRARTLEDMQFLITKYAKVESPNVASPYVEAFKIETPTSASSKAEAFTVETTKVESPKTDHKPGVIHVE